MSTMDRSGLETPTEAEVVRDDIIIEPSIHDLPDGLPPVPPSEKKRGWAGLSLKRRIAVVAGGVGIAGSGIVFAARGGGDSEPQALEDTTELAGGAGFGASDAVGVDTLEGAEPVAVVDTDESAFDISEIDGSRELTREEIDALLEDIPISDELKEKVVSLEAFLIREELENVDTLTSIGAVPFVRYAPRGFAPTGWLVWDDGEIFDTIHPDRRIDADGNEYQISYEAGLADVNRRFVEGGILTQEQVDREAENLFGGGESNNISDESKVGAPDQDEQNSSEQVEVGLDLTAEEMLALPLDEASEILTPTQKSQLAIAAYEEATDGLSIDILMSDEASLQIFQGRANLILESAAASGDVRILWALYEDINSEAYTDVADSIEELNFQEFAETQSNVIGADSLTINGDSAILATPEGENSLVFDGKFWKFS